MNKQFRRAGLAALLGFASVAALSLSMPAYSAQRAAPAKKEEGPAVRKEIGVLMNDALKAMNMNDFATATAKLQQADMIPMKSPYEDFSIAEYMGAIAVKQMDYAAATAAFNRQIASGGAPDEKKVGMYSLAMKLNYQNMDLPKVIVDAAELQKLRPLDEQEQLIYVTAYYDTNDFKNAAETAKTLNAARAAAGMKASADLLGIQLNSQAKLMDDAGYRQTLDQLALVSAQPDVWNQEIQAALATKGMSDHHLLNLYRLSMLVGSMADSDYNAMATIDLQNGLPNEAKAVLAKGNKTGDLVNQANQFLAKDQAALPALAAEAAKQTNGEVDVKLGESYMSYGRYDEAVAAIQKGIEKGGLKDLADAQTTLGIALFSAGKKDDAAAQFDKASMASSPAAAVAHAWSLFSRRTV